MKTKKAFITILLVEESEEKSNKEIEKEIFESLSEGLPTIPCLFHKVLFRAEGLYKL